MKTKYYIKNNKKHVDSQATLTSPLPTAVKSRKSKKSRAQDTGELLPRVLPPVSPFFLG